tara:strand:- start:3237 stop:4859 length:1623 start_codon:yes stop_codon:yes gene_type:complete
VYKIRIVGNYYNKEEPDFNKYFQKMADSTGGWGDITLVEKDEDFIVVINWLHDNDPDINPEKTILIQMEPPSSISLFPGIFCNINSYTERVLFTHYKNAIEWWISPSYSDIKNNKIDLTKTKQFSTVMSAERWIPGHVQRLELLCSICKEFEIDVWGRGHADKWIPEEWSSAGREMGYLPFREKDKGLFPYKYTYAAENTAVKNYFTEKIVDAILSECLCFYWGCPNLHDFIDPRAYIPITVHDHQHSLSVIDAAIKNNEWEKRLPYIKEAKQKILDELQFFPMLQNIIKKRIPAIRKTDRFKDKKRVISFSLYGKDPLYTDGAIRCVKYGKHKYPEWEWRFYVGDSVPEHVCDVLSDLGCNLIYMKGKPEDLTAMSWRFLAAEDADISIFRDTDSVILWRELHAVNEWLESNKTLHCMRDHRWHDIPVLAGMWGIKGKIPDIADIISRFYKKYPDFKSRKGGLKSWCQKFLHECIWSKYKDDSIAHVGHDKCILYGKYMQRETSRIDQFGAVQLDFLTPRRNGEHIGQINPPRSHNTDY